MIDVETYTGLNNGPADESWHPRAQYLSLDKGFGAVPTEQLERLAAELAESDKPYDLECAGSAYIEAAIFSPYRTEDTLDHDLSVVKYGIHLMQQAADGYWAELERGEVHPDDQVKALRAELNVAFANVYCDILDGGLTPDTREETYAELVRLGRYSYELAMNIHKFKYDDAQISFRQSPVGLTYEIAVLLAGLTAEDSILIPSSTRAASGKYNGQITNDFSLLTLDEQGYLNFSTPIELKAESDSMRRMKAEGRYNPEGVVLVHARRDLDLHWEDMPRLFGQRALTPDAHRHLAYIRYGLQNSVYEAWRRFDSNGLGDYDY